jgi:hypothetical protein
VAEGTPEVEPTLVERWLQDQQEWQRTLRAYFDSMVKDDDFLVNLGNAMRGSLLAGKPYPAGGAAAASAPAPADERLDQVLFALNKLQGQLQDLFMTLEEISHRLNGTAPASAPLTPKQRATAKPIVSPKPRASSKPVRAPRAKAAPTRKPRARA